MSIQKYRRTAKRHALGNHRRRSGSGSTPMKDAHKYQIQHHIHQRCHRNKHHGQLTFTHAPENRTQRIIAIDKNHAAAANHQVPHSFIPGRTGGIHQSQNALVEYYADCAHDHRQNQLSGQQGTNGLGYFFAFHSNLLRNNNLSSIREAHSYCQEQIGQLSPDAHRRKARRSAKLPHNNHIHHAVNRLQQICQHHGNGKPNEPL